MRTFRISETNKLAVVEVIDDKELVVALFGFAAEDFDGDRFKRNRAEADAYLGYLEAREDYARVDGLASDLNLDLVKARNTGGASYLLSAATNAAVLWKGLRQLFGVTVNIPAPLDYVEDPKFAEVTSIDEGRKLA